GNTLEVMTAGHQIRNGAFNSLPGDTIDTGEVFDCVVVGGGVSGLSAALFFKKYGGPKLNCLVLDNHPVFGGEAKRNEFIVDGQRIIGPQGAPISDQMRAELLKYHEQQKSGLPFEYPGDAKSRQIDNVTIEQYLMENYGLSKPTIQTFMADEGSGHGAGPDVLSAYCIY